MMLGRAFARRGGGAGAGVNGLGAHKEEPWHPIAYAYRSAIFLLNLQPIDWELMGAQAHRGRRGRPPPRRRPHPGVGSGGPHGALVGDRAGARGPVAFGDMVFDSPEIFGERAKSLALAGSTCHDRTDIKLGKATS